MRISGESLPTTTTPRNTIMNGPDPGILVIGGRCSSSTVWTKRRVEKATIVSPKLQRYLEWPVSHLWHTNFGKLRVDQFLRERAHILSEPKKTTDRRGELRPLDISYLNIGGTDKGKSKSKSTGQATVRPLLLMLLTLRMITPRLEPMSLPRSHTLVPV
jgi:hypothetical protein